MLSWRSYRAPIPLGINSVINLAAVEGRQGEGMNTAVEGRQGEGMNTAVEEEDGEKE